MKDMIYLLFVYLDIRLKKKVSLGPQNQEKIGGFKFEAFKIWGKNRTIKVVGTSAE